MRPLPKTSGVKGAFLSHLTRALLIFFAVGLAACAGDQDVDIYDGATPAPVQAAVWNSCTNPAARYTIRYPQEWHTNIVGPLEECRLFDPEPIAVPDEPEDMPLDVGVILRVEPVSFADFTAATTGLEIISEEEFEVDLHMAVRQALVATEQRPYPEGTQVTRYAIDRDGETLIAESFDAGEPPYERKVQVLDEMMSEIEFTSDG